MKNNAKGMKKMNTPKNESAIIEYILVNKELGMGIGKTAGQVAHCQTIIDKHFSQTEEYKYWIENAQTKIILSGTEEDLKKWIEKGAVVIKDKGLTEIAPGSLTCVGFPPQKRGNLKSLTANLPLLK
jgi:PTH2 family peptidyl-tRNA hydrolase